jgi:aromatic ring-cleaving dioxygenase
MVWMHFVGFAEQEFQALAEFSQGRRGGLNRLVAEAVSPSSSTTDRSHVSIVRFSGEPVGLHRRSAIEGDLLVHTTSMPGPAYDVHNPFAKFSISSEV